jgi:4-aminobutyrate aminotransferase-like enzyme
MPGSDAVTPSVLSADSTAELQARRDRALGRGAPLFYTQPLELVRGEGVHVFDTHGTRYVDLYNNVPCVGHANPRVAEAMRRQQLTLNVHSRYLHNDIVEFAERLTALHGPAVESVVFSCSGTEANDVAIRMARVATGRRGIVCSSHNYHGSSELINGLARAATDPAAFPEVRTFPFPDTYRPIQAGLSETQLADLYLAELDRSIDSLQHSGTGLAAMLICPLLANEGVPTVPSDFFGRAVAMVHDAGGLVISDEVQAGYGRTGDWWGYQHAGFQPDVVVTGKPMGNGLPIAATAASRVLVEQFRDATRYFNTFASSPLQAAVGLAVLDEIEQRELLLNAAELGTRLMSELTSRAQGCDWIGDVRGRGLFVGIDVVADPTSREPDAGRALDVVNRLKDKGYLTSTDGAYDNMVKIRPPLVIAPEHIAGFLTAFDDVCEDIRGGP